jgi:hypothetical protein
VTFVRRSINRVRRGGPDRKEGEDKSQTEAPKKYWLLEWAPAISLVSLVTPGGALGVSAATFLNTASATAVPDLALTAPGQVRVEFDPDYSVIYAQPVFTVTNVTSRVDPVFPMELRVRPEVGAESASEEVFNWRHVVKFGWSANRQTEFFEAILSDPVPLLVALSSPQSPMAEFDGPADYFQPETCYRLRIIARRTANPVEMTASVWLRNPQDKYKNLQDRKNATETTSWGQHLARCASVAESECHPSARRSATYPRTSGPKRH